MDGEETSPIKSILRGPQVPVGLVLYGFPPSSVFLTSVLTKSTVIFVSGLHFICFGRTCNILTNYHVIFFPIESFYY